MEVRYSKEAEVYRSELRKVLKANLPVGWQGIGALSEDEREKFAEEWKKVLHQNGLLAVNWPKEYGGAGLSFIERVILNEELTYAGAELDDVKLALGVNQLGPTLMAVGTEEQREYFLPRILSGKHQWCQGYSEPNSGSDLAGLAASAYRDGDEWVINGQKIWTSEAHTANWIYLLVRTDAEAPKHEGVTFMLVDMNQPGVEVRKVVNICGSHDFNEVFFTNARTPHKYVVGDVNKGWSVSTVLLSEERGNDPTQRGIIHRAQLNTLIEAARERGVLSDPIMRQRLAKAHTDVEIMRWLGLKMLSDALNNRPTGPEGSLFKIMWSEYHQWLTNLAMDIIGIESTTPWGMKPANFFIDLPGAPFSTRSWMWSFLAARSDTIRGGTGEIQRNIVGERVLGLPKEVRMDKGPWNKTLR